MRSFSQAPSVKFDALFSRVRLSLSFATVTEKGPRNPQNRLTPQGEWIDPQLHRCPPDAG